MNNIDSINFFAIEKSDQSSQFWVTAFYLLPLFLLLLASVFSPHKPLTTTNIEVIETAQAYRSYLFAGIYFLALVVVLTRLSLACNIAIRHLLYLVFLLYVICTANWSYYPEKVMMAWVHSVGTYLTCLAAVLAPGIQKQNIIRTVLLFAIVSVAATLFLVVFFPDRGIMEIGSKMRWIGCTTSANLLGAVMLLAVWACWTVFYSSKSLASRGAVIVLLTLAIVCMYGSDSMTSILIAVLVTCGFPFVIRLSKLPQPWALIALLVLGMLFFVSILVFYIAIPDMFTLKSMLHNFTYIGRTATFTGRTKLWESAVKAIAERPLLGWSFDALSSASGFYNVGRIHLHNGYLEILVAGGVFCFVLLVAMILHILFRLLKLIRQDILWGASLSMLMMIVLLHNLAESFFGRPPSLQWIMFTLIYLVLSTYRIKCEPVGILRP